MQLAILIFFCGGVGALLRHLISMGVVLYGNQVERLLYMGGNKLLQGIGVGEKNIFELRSLKFPWATLGANALAAFILGSLVAFSVNNSAVAAWFDRVEHAFRLPKKAIAQAMMIGFCGSLSTFSTFTKETLVLIENGNYSMAAVNVLANMGFSALLFLGGLRLSASFM